MLYFYWIHYIVIHFFSNLTCLYKEYIIWRILFNKFSDLLPACTSEKGTSNFQSICLRVNILSRIAKSTGGPFSCADFNGNILLLKALKVNFRPS